MNQPELSNSGTVLVTGARGMLGSHIVEILLQQGYRVKAMVRPGSLAPDLQGLPVELCYGDIRDADACAAALHGCIMVVHSAALISIWPTQSATLFDVNLKGTQNMVKASMDAGIQRFVYISSANCIGPGDPSHPATEDTPFRGAHYGLDYINSKYAAHQYVMETARIHGFPAILICPTMMIGPNDVNLGSGQMIVAVSTRKLRFVSRGGKNFVDVRDVAHAAVNALRQGKPGESYITGHSNLSYQEFFNLIGEVTHVEPPRLLIPGWIILTIGFVGTALARLFNFRPLLSYPQALLSLERHCYSPAKAVRELDMPQTDIKIAVQAAYEWLKREKYC